MSSEHSELSENDSDLEFEEMMRLIQMKVDCGSEEEEESLTQAQQDVRNLGCHFNWIRTVDLKKVDLSQSKKQCDSWMEHTKDDKLFPYYKSLTQRLIKALLFYLRGEFDNSMDHLDKSLRELEDRHVHEPFLTSHYSAYKFILEANLLVLKLRLGEMGMGESLRESVFGAYIDESASRAVLILLESLYVGWFDDFFKQKELLQQVLELEPDNPEYLIEYNRMLRRIRREDDFLSAPSDEEHGLIKRICDLAPEKAYVLFNLGNFYHDTLKCRVKRKKESMEEILAELETTEVVKRMVLYTKLAFELNPDCVSVCIRYAEVLTYGKYGLKFKDFTDGAYEECEKQFQYCVDRWPDNSEVLHKIGKFYILTDFHRGMDYLKNGLEANAENLPCLMDLVRYRYRREKNRSIPQLMEYFDINKISLFKRPSSLKKVRILKGCLFLRDNRFEEALDLFILAFHGLSPQISYEEKELLLGSGLLENEPKFAHCQAMAKFLARKIEGLDKEEIEFGIIEALYSVFARETEFQEAHMRPCDKDTSWRSSPRLLPSDNLNNQTGPQLVRKWGTGQEKPYKRNGYEENLDPHCNKFVVQRRRVQNENAYEEEMGSYSKGYVKHSQENHFRRNGNDSTGNLFRGPSASSGSGFSSDHRGRLTVDSRHDNNWSTPLKRAVKQSNIIRMHRGHTWTKCPRILLMRARGQT